MFKLGKLCFHFWLCTIIILLGRKLSIRLGASFFPCISTMPWDWLWLRLVMLPIGPLISQQIFSKFQYHVPCHASPVLSSDPTVGHPLRLKLGCTRTLHSRGASPRTFPAHTISTNNS